MNLVWFLKVFFDFFQHSLINTHLCIFKDLVDVIDSVIARQVWDYLILCNILNPSSIIQFSENICS